MLRHVRGRSRGFVMLVLTSVGACDRTIEVQLRRGEGDNDGRQGEGKGQNEEKRKHMEYQLTKNRHGSA